jgi:[acyl-carrier-protein] S-malonyltransferase
MTLSALPSSRTLAEEIPHAALVFRGYNVTNLGRSAELLAHDAFRPIVQRYLREAGQICAEYTGKRVDLVGRVRGKREPSLRCYAESIALIVAMEFAQLELLTDLHGIDAHRAQLAYGYSLGELAAVSYGGLFSLEEVLRIPLTMARDCAELARDVTMGVVFSRGPVLREEQVQRLCLSINGQCRGLIGVSSVLAPNTMLVLGQGDTVKQFGHAMRDTLDHAVHLRINPHRWPPLHTPIMWQRCVPNRSALLMQQIPGRSAAVRPPVVPLTEPGTRYTDLNARELLHRWVDHPQRLWGAICETLGSGIRTVIHVGPEPNLVPATFKRLADNVQQQVSRRSLGSLGLRAVSGMVHRPWLAGLLPSRTSLLRAPTLRHVILEDWLLNHQDAARS